MDEHVKKLNPIDLKDMSFEGENFPLNEFFYVDEETWTYNK